jgi:membrane associated rhomboid family serine protease
MTNLPTGPSGVHPAPGREQYLLPGKAALPHPNYSPIQQTYGRAYATMGIIALCVLAFLFQLVIGLPDELSYNDLGAIHFYQTFVLQREAFTGGAFWQVVTHMFLHGNLMHIGGNMLGVAFTGPLIERFLGRRHFLAIFFLGGFVGGLAQIITSDVPLLGASGGVYALILAVVTYQPRAKLMVLMFFILPIPMRARTLGWGLILSSVFFIIAGTIPFLRPFSLPQVGHVAHLGGGLLGWAYLRFGRLTRDDEPFFTAGWQERGDFPPPGHPRESWPSYTALPPHEPFGRPAGQAGAAPPPRLGMARDPAYEALLDKVEREGLGSLTAAELRLLESGGRPRQG